jgi:hypothetical protein
MRARRISWLGVSTWFIVVTLRAPRLDRLASRPQEAASIATDPLFVWNQSKTMAEIWSPPDEGSRM